MRNFDKQTVLNAIKDSYGITSRVAKKLNCDWGTADRYIKKYKDALEAVNNEQNFVLDLAEGKLFEAINRGEQWAIKFFLTMKGQSRGYIATPTIKLDNGEPLNIQFSGMSKAELLNADNVEINEGANETSES